jgi:hypothetical protein
MQRATGLAAGIGAAREAQAECAELRLVPSNCWHMCLDAPPTSGSLTSWVTSKWRRCLQCARFKAPFQ